jgi:hypothetical protein
MIGRGCFRVSQVLSASGLQFGWGTERFAHYSAALAAAGWLTAVAAAGGEKTLIALLPRPAWSGVGRVIVRAALLWLGVIAGTAAVVVVVVGPGARVWMAAAVYGAGLGTVFVCVAMLRLAGRWHFDPIAMLMIGSAHLAVVPLAVTGWSPVRVVTVLGLVTAGVAVATGIAAWRSAPEAGGVRRPAGLVREVLFTGTSEVANMVAVAVVFVILAGSRYAEQAGDLFLVGLVGQMLIGAAAYLVRLTGASRSWTAYVAGRTADRTAARRLRRCAAVSLFHLAAIGALVLFGDAVGLPERAVVIVTAALAVPPTLITLRGSAIAEFGSRAGRRSAAIGSGAGLLAGSLLAVVLVPVAGAPGGALTLVAGVTGQALLAGRLLDRSADENR